MAEWVRQGLGRLVADKTGLPCSSDQTIGTLDSA